MCYHFSWCSEHVLSLLEPLFIALRPSLVHNCCAKRKDRVNGKDEEEEEVVLF